MGAWECRFNHIRIMTLRQLIERLECVGRSVSSSDIPVKCGGNEIDVQTQLYYDIDENGVVKSVYVDLKLFFPFFENELNQASIPKEKTLTSPVDAYHTYVHRGL